MQSLDIISINLWQILISLANLLIIFLIFKKLLFKPVQNILAARQQQVDKLRKAVDGLSRSAGKKG